MSSLLLRNACLVELDPPGVLAGCLRVCEGMVIERAEVLEAQPGETVIDCVGAVVMPGLVNGHTHLYSALAVGMPAPPRLPRDFHEILELIWWRLDRALDAHDNLISARTGALEALCCGTTTLIDHHASPNAIEGSLDQIEAGVAQAGLRAVLCYETTGRNGADGARAGLDENRRYLGKCAVRGGGQFAAMAGAHAAFTCSDATLEQLAALAREFNAGVHIHVAEDPCDDRLCREHFGRLLIDRLTGCGLFAEGSIFAHGVHLDTDERAQLANAGAWAAHNPRSNMNNGVGYALRQGGFAGPVMLGTDGIGSDMWTEARCAWFKSCEEGGGLSPADVVAMQAASARMASRHLGLRLGTLQPGAAADLIVTNLIPSTPLEAGNLPGHLLYGMGPQYVRDVMIAGQWRLKDGVPTAGDPSQWAQESAAAARALWGRMENL